MTKPPYQINSSLRKNYQAHHPQESGGGMVDDVVPISLGGTGATTAQGARENLGTNDASNLTTGTLPNDRVSNSLPPNKAFRRGNILGTVSQSSGVPTGAIIERGSNANGQYVRFADGTQICHFYGTVTNQAISTAYSSSGLFIGERTWTFPAQFASNHIVSFHQGRWSTGASWSSLATVTTTSANYRFIDISSRPTGMNFVFNVVAIGRWF